MATIPEYNSTPWGLPVGCFSIVIKTEAIHRSFPGGVRAFEQAYKPIRKSWVLYLLMAFTREAADRVVARLAEDGLKPGVDVAVADKVRRPILECPGVVFTDHGRHQWTVDFVSEPPLKVPVEAGAATADVTYTTVTGLTRKADRSRFLEDLELAVMSEGLAAWPTVRERNGFTSIEISRAELSALITFDHTRRDPVPLVHWYDAQADLRIVATAWSSVNQFHRRKATSFPEDLNEVIGCLLRGLQAARDGSAFLPRVKS